MNAIGLILLALLVSDVHALDTKALDALSSAQLEAIHNDPFTGSFRDKSGSLRLYTLDQLNYEGEILFKGELYLLKAMREGERLQGHIIQAGKRYNFELYFQGESLVFDSKQGQFALQPNLSHNARPYPELKPQIIKPKVKAPIPVTNEYHNDWEGSISYLAPQVSQDLESFVSALRQWFTGKLGDKEATELVKLRLLPLTALLAQNLEKLEKVAKTQQKRRLPIEKIHQWQHLEKISAHSHKFFSQWQSLLQQMLYLNQQGKQKQLKTLANERLPIAIKNTQIIVQRLYTLLSEFQQSSIIANSSPPLHYLQPDKLLKMENLGGMLEMMREMMRLFREMFFPG